MSQLKWKSEPAEATYFSAHHLEFIEKYIQDMKVCDPDCYACRVMGVPFKQEKFPNEQLPGQE